MGNAIKDDRDLVASRCASCVSTTAQRGSVRERSGHVHEPRERPPHEQGNRSGWWPLDETVPIRSSHGPGQTVGATLGLPSLLHDFGDVVAVTHAPVPDEKQREGDGGETTVSE